MRVVALLGVAGLVAAGPLLAQGAPESKPLESAGFVLTRGQDTVAHEHFERFDVTWKGALILPRALDLTQQWSVVISPDGSVPLVEVTVTEEPPRPEFSPRMLTRTRLIVRDDSVAVDQMTNQGLVTRVLPTEPGVRPYLNLSFALLELALQAAPAGPEATITFFNLDGGQTAKGTLRRHANGTATLLLGTTEIALDLDGSRIRSARIDSQGLRATRTK